MKCLIWAPGLVQEHAQHNEFRTGHELSQLNLDNSALKIKTSCSPTVCIIYLDELLTNKVFLTVSEAHACVFLASRFFLLFCHFRSALVSLEKKK